MLGLSDRWIAAAYLLCLLSTLLCVVYGAIAWNKGDGMGGDAEEDRHWEEEEKELEEEL